MKKVITATDIIKQLNKSMQLVSKSANQSLISFTELKQILKDFENIEERTRLEEKIENRNKVIDSFLKHNS